MTITTTRRLLLGASLALILAACGGGTAASPSGAAVTDPPAASPSEAPSAAASPSEAASAAASGAASPSGGGDATVTLAENELGMILVGPDGKTLYGFTADTAGTSTCYEGCAAAWPPLTADGEVTAGPGLDASLLTTVERTDGTMQVKYGDWPLYYWASDTAPGDATGQGVNDVWYVVGADGELIGQ